MAAPSAEISQRPCDAVLIVEDDTDIREAIRDLLECEGWRVLSAANGSEALQVLHTFRRPCLILLDLMMPVMNGWQFLQERMQDHVWATIPVVIVSAVADEARRQASRRGDIAGFIKKPIELEAIIRTVEKFCMHPPNEGLDKAV